MRRFRHAVLFTVALVAPSASPSALRAQFPADVHSGVRVRVWVPEPYRQMEGPVRRQLLRGTVETVTPDTLRLSIPGTVDRYFVSLSHSVSAVSIKKRPPMRL